MELLSSLLMGIIQGLTEFLPISSSGHLIFFRDITNTQFEYGLAFDAILQLATTLAIVVYFRKEIYHLIKDFFLFISGKVIQSERKNMIIGIIVGTIPAIILGLLLEDLMDTVFRNSVLVAGTLVLGSLIMFIADKISFKNKKDDKEITAKRAILVGLFQSLALIPGMSRSGMSISGGLIMGLNRELAIKFSFLLATPILLGSGLKKMLDLGGSGLLSSIGLELFLGSLSAFIVGLLAIRFLIKYLKNHSFKIFIYYRLFLAAAILLFYFTT